MGLEEAVGDAPEAVADAAGAPGTAVPTVAAVPAGRSLAVA